MRTEFPIWQPSYEHRFAFTNMAYMIPMLILISLHILGITIHPDVSALLSYTSLVFLIPALYEDAIGILGFFMGLTHQPEPSSGDEITPTEWLKANIRPKRVYGAGYVYIIQETDITGAYKIGRSKIPIARMNDFGVLLPFNFEIIHCIQTPDCYALESRLHDRYHHKRGNGEWFALSSADVEWLKQLQ